MASNETVRRALLEMGVDSAKALHASQRYETPEAAINWVFGEGESVSFIIGCTVLTISGRRMMVAGCRRWRLCLVLLPDVSCWAAVLTVDTSPVEDTPSDGPIIFGSNNPFLNLGSAESKPPIPRRPEERSERERSVRASAPPPDGEEEGEIIGPLIGASDKEDKDGKLAVTVSAPDVSCGDGRADWRHLIRRRRISRGQYRSL